MRGHRPALQLDWDQVVGWRLRRHHLDERAPSGHLLAVVAEIAGLHAQVMSSAELTLWTRIEGLDRDAVRDALWRDRTPVKTWAMRAPCTCCRRPSSRSGRRRSARRAAHARAVQGPRLPAAGLALPVLLAGGRMLGTWRQEPKGRRLRVTVEPFAKLGAAVRRQTEHEAERLAAWTGATLDLAWTDPAV